MNILPRLVAISLRKYTAHPDERVPAVSMMLRNAMRLAILHLGREHAEEVARETLLESVR